ncbi:MAG TPA: exosortase A [Nitrosospira sp.]|nr:exosortase A [Nitrosospira sp.]
MSAQTTRELPSPSTITDQQNFKLSVTIASVTVVVILLSYFQTAWSMVSIWGRSDTFAHGFLIFPFSAYLIWSQRSQLASVNIQPNLPALLVLAGVGLGWLLATLASAQVVAQFFLIAMIPASVWVILGTNMVRALAFPLGYLLLAVPFGEALIPPLINFTADFTVRALQLTGIPVYREGSFFTIPSGNWSVVEACSGLRYLIASFTLGTLYAYLTYRSLPRRLIFITLSVIVPILANGIRAYLIVMTGHLSEMRLAVGIDHLIYGWVFFGVVMLLLFWIGTFWREDQPSDNATVRKYAIAPNPLRSEAPLKKILFATGATMAGALVWPAYAAFLENGFATHERPATLDIAGIPQKWEVNSGEVSGWRPYYVGPTAQLAQYYRSSDRPERTIGLVVTYYRNQQQGSELINSQNLLTPEDGGSDESRWRDVRHDVRALNLGSGVQEINQNLVQSSSLKLLVWRTYWLGDEITASPYVAKLILAKNKLLGRPDDGAEIIFVTAYDESPDEAIPALERFGKEMIPSIISGLRNAAGS